MTPGSHQAGEAMRDWRKRSDALQRQNEALQAERDPLILSAWLRGWPVSQIATQMGTTRPTVYKALGEGPGTFKDPDRCEIECTDGDEGTRYVVRAWSGAAEACTDGMPAADATAFLTDVMGLDESDAEKCVYNARQSRRPYRVL